MEVENSKRFQVFPKSGPNINGLILDDIALMTRDQQKRTIPVNAQVHLDAMIKKLYPSAAELL